MGFDRLWSLFSKKNYIRPIVDPYVYENNINSTCGNSLEYSNIVITINSADDYQTIDLLTDRFDRENAKYSIKICPDSAGIEQIISRLDKLELCEHFINVFRLSNDCENELLLIYKTLQIESDYLIKSDCHGTITIAVIGKYSEVSEAVKSLIHGLGLALGNHQIVINGVIAGKKVPFEHVTAALTYLNGKYGQILAGEIINMEEKNEQF